MQYVAMGPKRACDLYPSRKWPNAASLRRSHMILVIANMGIERMTPGIPHIQNQKASEMITKTGFKVKRLASIIGVALSPSIK